MATSYSWEKNSGSGWVAFEGTPTAQNPTEDFDEGTWSVRVTATDPAFGSDVKTINAYVVVSAAPSYEGPLDLVPGGVTAYFWGQRAGSASQLGTPYATVREAGGDTEQEFNYDAVDGTVPSASIISFLDGADGFVKIWNEADGNDFVQETALDQFQWSADVVGGQPGFVNGSAMTTMQNVVVSGGEASIFFVTAGFTELYGDDGADAYIDVQAAPDGDDAYCDMSDGTNESGRSATVLNGAEMPQLFEFRWKTGDSRILINGSPSVLNNDFDFGTSVGLVECLLQVFQDEAIVEILLCASFLTNTVCENVRVNFSNFYEQAVVTTPPAISPDPANAGDLLSVTNGTWNDGGSAAFTYQWFDNYVAVGAATNSTYQTATPAQNGHQIYCKVTNTNAWGAFPATTEVLILGTP